jgi:hypothetical protein
MALEAVDVGLRAVNDYMWQDNPWHLYGDPVPNRTLNGVDYILAYWLGRYHGFLDKDDPIQCLRWH